MQISIHKHIYPDVYFVQAYSVDVPMRILANTKTVTPGLLCGWFTSSVRARDKNKSAQGGDRSQLKKRLAVDDCGPYETCCATRSVKGRPVFLEKSAAGTLGALENQTVLSIQAIYGDTQCEKLLDR